MSLMTCLGFTLKIISYTLLYASPLKVINDAYLRMCYRNRAFHGDETSLSFDETSSFNDSAKLANLCMTFS